MSNFLEHLSRGTISMLGWNFWSAFSAWSRSKSSSNKWPRTSYRDYLHRITNFCATVSNIFSKEIISNKTKCRKQLLKFIRTLESTSTTKLMSKFYLLLHYFSDSYNLFSRDSIGSCLWCYFSLLFISLALLKM